MSETSKATDRALAWLQAAQRLDQDTMNKSGAELRAAVDRLVTEFRIRGDEGATIAVSSAGSWPHDEVVCEDCGRRFQAVACPGYKREPGKPVAAWGGDYVYAGRVVAQDTVRCFDCEPATAEEVRVWKDDGRAAPFITTPR